MVVLGLYSSSKNMNVVDFASFHSCSTLLSSFKLLSTWSLVCIFLGIRGVCIGGVGVRIHNSSFCLHPAVGESENLLTLAPMEVIYIPPPPLKC
jgi:hypothetical protein